MLLTDEEFQEFKTQFYCAGASYERYCVPLSVETPDGADRWISYVAAEDVTAALDWLAQRRRKPAV